MYLSAPPRGLRLSKVIPQGHWLRGDELPVASCCSEANQCEQGDLFVILDDTHLENQENVETAIARGASAILAERVIPCSLPQYIVGDSRIAYGQLCHALSGSPAQSLRTIGITGSFGKSTTQRLLMAILKAAQVPYGAMGSHGELTDAPGASMQSSPGPATIAHWLANTRANGATHAVLEASSQSLSRNLFSGLELDAAVITNIRREHSTFHGSLKNYQKAKARLIQHLKPSGFAVMNSDDRASRALIAELDLPVLTIGMRHPAEVSATLVERHVSEQTFLIDIGDESIAVRTPIIGDAHIYNCLSAAAVALILGVDPTQIVRGLESIESVGGCIQRIECGQPFGTFIDASFSPEAVGTLLQCLQEVTRGRLHCVLGVDHRVSAEDRARTGRVLEKYADSTILTASQLDRRMALNSAHDLLDGFDRPAQAQLMPDRARAICWTLAQAQPGDVVLLAGGRASLGPDQVPLSDEDVTRYWLCHASDTDVSSWASA